MTDFTPIPFSEGDLIWQHMRASEDDPLIRYASGHITQEGKELIKAHCKAHPEQPDWYVALLFSVGESAVYLIRKA